jgi:hypothetical protein
MTWASFVAGVANDLTNEIVKAAPKGRTGDLKNGIQLESATEDGDIVISIPKEGLWVEFGTPPHTIEASPGKTLHWVNESGDDVFAKRVEHPGTRANPFIRPTLHQKLPIIIGDNTKRHLE